MFYSPSFQKIMITELELRSWDIVLLNDDDSDDDNDDGLCHTGSCM